MRRRRKICARGVMWCCSRRCSSSSRSPSMTRVRRATAPSSSQSANAIRAASQPQLQAARPAGAAAVRGRRAHGRRGARCRLRRGDRRRRRCRGLARQGDAERARQAAEEEKHAALSRGRGSVARSRRRAGRGGLQRGHADDLSYGSGQAACRAMSAMALPPMGSRRCCITPGAARGPSWRRRGTKASKSRRWRSRNAACPRRSPACCARPAHRRFWWRRRRTKMPYLRPWSVLCGPVWRKRSGRIRCNRVRSGHVSVRNRHDGRRQA